MAPVKNKRKISKTERQKRATERGKKSAETRGKGVGSRKKFSLPAKWKELEYKRGNRKKLKFKSPGKTVYMSQKCVKKSLLSRNMKECILDRPASSEEEVKTDESEFLPTSDEESNGMTLGTTEGEGEGTEGTTDTGTEASEFEGVKQMERRLFVCESTQLMDLVEQVNETSRCSTIDCNGLLVLTKVEATGLGGTLNATFVCSSCQLRSINFQGSVMVEGSKRTVVGLALGVAFFISGHGFAKFDKTLRQFLGISCVSKNRYYDIIKLVYPHITCILNEMCVEEKAQMKSMDPQQLGSWKNAVVTSDGVWHTRGHFSKNGSFIIKNYITGGLLWYGHKCMRGQDDIIDEELYEGTAKSMEGVLSDECYKQAKEEGCSVNTVWQDGDSSASKSFNTHHPDGKVYKCGGHVGRAHTNCLKEASKKKEFSADIKRKYKQKFPLVENVRCKCARHKASCGCLSDAFIKGARINHFCVLQQCKDPAEYARRMRALSEYHCRDVHQWDGGSCGFHNEQVCSCKKCDEDEVKCQGSQYHTKCPLKCDYHWLAYRLECEKRAEDADSIIHPVMGRGHSNLCEAHFTVLPQFRAKDQSLNRLHYMASTNAGFCQGNMTWCHQVRGANYSWVTDLYERLNLPVMPAIVEAIQKATEERATVMQKQKSDETKRNRVKMKVARAEDQESRKKWLKRQAVQHTYGEADGDDDEIDVPGGAEVGDTTVISGRKCRCNSTEHSRTSHRSCPLNKNNAV